MKRHCTKCGRNRPLSAFGVHDHTRDGLSSWCDECRSKQRNEQNALPSLQRGFWTCERRKKLQHMWRLGVSSEEIIVSLDMQHAGKNALANAIKRYLTMADRKVRLINRRTPRALPVKARRKAIPGIDMTSSEKQQLSLADPLPVGHPATLWAFREFPIYHDLLARFRHERRN